METEEKLLPFYDALFAEADLKFQGKIIDPTVAYETKLGLVEERARAHAAPELSRRELARLYYWLFEKFKRAQKSQRETMPDRYKSEDFKKYEKWEREYDPARHSIYTARKLSEKEVEARNINLDAS